MNDKPKNVKLIFAEALEKSTTTERGAYLDEACDEDADMRAEVEGLPRLTRIEE